MEHKDDARLARALLRVIQREPGIRRTHLTIQVRPYGERVFEVLDALIAKGIIIEDSVVLRKDAHKNRRAALVYRLSDQASEAAVDKSFDDMTPDSVGSFVASFVAA